jgi:hypothetical protein
MQFECATQSGEFRTTLWLRTSADAISHLWNAASSSGARPFIVGGEQYALGLRATHSAHAFEFSWAPRVSRLVPPILGTATVRRLGPLTAITLRGSYSVTADTPGSLAHAAVGRNAARRALDHASRAIAFTIRQRIHHGA